MRALRARLKQAEQELDILKSLGHLRPADSVSTYEHIAQRAAQVPVRQLCQVLCVAPAAYSTWQRRRQEPTIEPVWQVSVR